MKQASIFVWVLLCTLPFSSLAASHKHSKVLPKDHTPKTGKDLGEFSLMARGGDNTLILGNDLIYKPAHDHEVRRAENWQIGATIRILETKKKKWFILVNRDTGTSIKASIYHWD